jgi:Ni/Co efflux regulator RcnB
MRSLLLATVAGFGLALAGPAMAQHAPAGGHWHGGGGQWHGSNGGQWHWSRGSGSRHWGGSIGGRWIGGARAPGGWSAYRRPVRGWAMPSYWLAPSFYITDWGAYGLTAPPYGYHWSRYYDDAVLVDQYGRSMDCVQGVDWQGDVPDGYDDHGDYDYDYSHDAGPGAP